MPDCGGRTFVSLVQFSFHTSCEMQENARMLRLTQKVLDGAPMFVRHHFQKKVLQDEARVKGMCDWI